MGLAEAIPSRFRRGMRAMVTELAKARPGPRGTPQHKLYLLDEPTVGLHMAGFFRTKKLFRE